MESTQQTKQFKYVDDAQIVAAFQADLDAICLKHNVAISPTLVNTDSSITCQIRLIQRVEPATIEQPHTEKNTTNEVPNAEIVAEAVEILESMEAAN